jgi:hypothetical protein
VTDLLPMTVLNYRACSSVLVEGLYYKLEGHGFES